jgi:hypothetical protein
VVAAFEEHAQHEPGLFAQRTAELYRSRVGVTYLLPPHADLESFYRDVVERFVRRDHTRTQATEADVVNALLGADGWRRAWRAARRGPAAAVAAVRQRLKQEVKRLFTEGDDVDAAPVLPTMASLLARAARRENLLVAGDDVRQFEAKIHGLVPAGFTPQGTGDLKILISYPAGGPDAAIERFLRTQLRIPRESKIVVEFRPINAESITVVLFRTSMSITEVPEVREIIHLWSDALANPRRDDFLKWRQRLGYDFGWLATTAEQRVRILHHLLCAMWNDHVDIRDGKPESPGVIRIQLTPEDDEDNRVSMTLPLTPFGPASSWGSLLRSYEEWVFADDEPIRRDFCEQLMRTAPTGVSGDVAPPGPIFEGLYRLAGVQVQDLAAVKGSRPDTAGDPTRARQLYDFWAHTFPAALDLPFEHVSMPVRRNLRELYEMTGRPRLGERPPAPPPDVGGYPAAPVDDDYLPQW